MSTLAVVAIELPPPPPPSCSEASIGYPAATCEGCAVDVEILVYHRSLVP